MPFGLDWELTTAIIFYVILAIVIYRYRSKFTIMDKILFVYKTKKPLAWMRKIAEHKVFFRIFSTLAIPVAVFFMLFVGQALFDNMIKIFTASAGPGIYPMIPGVRIPGSPIFVPLWFGLISIAVLAVVHEFSHGIVAAMEGIRLKSTGFGFLLVLPLAFVELDEKQMAKKPRLARLRVAAAGAFGNLVFYFILLAIALLAIFPVVNAMITPIGVNITGVENNLPAQIAGLKAGDVVTAINNYSVRNLTDFSNALTNVKPGDTVLIQTNDSVFFVKTTVSPSIPGRGYLGVSLDPNPVTEVKESIRSQFGILVDGFLWFVELVKWVALLNFLVGIVNFLPIWIFDGGRIAYDLFGYAIKNEKALYWTVNCIFAFYAVLMVMNFIGPFIVSVLR